MARELLLMRHGKSDWNLPLEDYQRPLKERGRCGAEQLGAWLLQQRRLPDYVVSSPAVRAFNTAKLALAAMGLDICDIVREKRIYEARVGDLLQVLGEIPVEARRVLMVGHNPGFEELVEYLSRDPVPLPKDGNLLPTASLAHLEMPEDWSPLAAGQGRLVSITRSGTLPKRFPFPDPQGKEYRERPAYYYDQVAVVPYRLVEGRPEILLVMSRKLKHWVVPKGIVEPFTTPRESAIREALEEAGVEGEIGGESLGCYRYLKWGGECRVEVFPMAVSREVSGETWRESRRGREWMPPKQAGKRLKQPELKSMIEQLAERLKDSLP